MLLLQRTYRCIALTLALCTFSSSVGFAIDLHYCSGALKNVNLVAKANSCHEKANKKVCPMHQHMDAEKQTSSKNNCCSNKTLFLSSDLERLNQNILFEKVDSPIIIAIINWYRIKPLFISKNTALAFYYNKVPPLPNEEILILHQLFLC